jgi:hypothetical protein
MSDLLAPAAADVVVIAAPITAEAAEAPAAAATTAEAPAAEAPAAEAPAAAPAAPAAPAATTAKQSEGMGTQATLEALSSLVRKDQEGNAGALVASLALAVARNGGHLVVVRKYRAAMLADYMATRKQAAVDAGKVPKDAYTPIKSSMLARVVRTLETIESDHKLRNIPKDHGAYAGQVRADFLASAPVRKEKGEAAEKTDWKGRALTAEAALAEALAQIEALKAINAMRPEKLRKAA